MAPREDKTPLDEILDRDDLFFSVEENSPDEKWMWAYYSGEWPTMEKTPWYLRVELWGISSCVLGVALVEVGYPGFFFFGLALTAVLYFAQKSRRIFLRYMWLRVQVAENMKLKKKVRKQIEAGDPNPNH